MHTNDIPRIQIAKAQAAFGNPHLHRFLKWKYHSEPILERAGQIYPIAVYLAPSSQEHLLDSVLLGLEKDVSFNRDDLISDSHFREVNEQAGVTLQNRPTFTMRELVSKPSQVGLRCGLGTYFEALDTCDALEWEILSKFSELTGSTAEAFEQFDRQLPLRSNLHAQVANPVRDGRHRSAAIAISTLIAYKDEGSYYLWLRRRSASNVAVHPGLLHVIPSFMFQPATSYLDEEFSVTHSIFREYLEEVFNRPEPREEGEEDWRYFYGDPRLRFLQQLLDTQRAQLYLTGIAVNLLNFRPEICTLLLIRSSEWYQQYTQDSVEKEQFQFNQEWAMAPNRESDEHSLSGRIRYRASDHEMMQEVSLCADQMVPPGAAAFWLGLDVLRRVL